MPKQKYSQSEVEEIRQLKHESIKRIAQLTGKTEKEIIYIKQKHKIYKQWPNQ